MGPTNSSFRCISPFGFHTGQQGAGCTAWFLEPGLQRNVCPCVLQTGQGSYLLPFGLRAVCEAQEVTEPVGGSHLSEQLRAASEGGQDPAMSWAGGAGGGNGGEGKNQGGLVDAQWEVRKPPLGPGRAAGRW